MNPIIKFISSDMFIIDLLILCLLSIFRFPKRKFWYIWLVLSASAAVVIGYYLPSLSQIPQSLKLLRDIVGYSFQFLLIIGVLMATCRISVLKAIYLSTYFYFIQHGCFCFDRIIRGTLAPTNWVIISHFLLLIGLWVVFWLFYFHKVNSDGLDKLRLWETVLISIILLFCCIFMNSYAQEAEQDNISFRIADLMCCVCGIMLQFSIYNSSVTQRDKEQIEKMWKEKSKQYEISKENIGIINVKVHDLKHQLNEFYNTGRIDESSLSEMKSEIDTYDSRIDTTGNKAMDTVLTEKALLCKKKNIHFTALCEAKNISFVRSSDIYVFFSNAIDNAIEAVEKLDDLDKKVISVSARQVEGMYYISVQNYTYKQVSFNQTGLPISTKGDFVHHGYGTQSMQVFANRYLGEIHFTQRDDIFYVNVVFPIYQEIEKQKKDFKWFIKALAKEFGFTRS